MQTISATVRNAARVGKDAKRLADALQRHHPNISDDRLRGGLHRVEVAVRDFWLAIAHAEAALSPAARAAIAAR